MPYVTTWAPPAVFVEYKGVKVYYAYKGGRDWPMTFWFTLSAEPSAMLFDVRELPHWPKGAKGVSKEIFEVDRALALRVAIANGSIRKVKLWPGEE